MESERRKFSRKKFNNDDFSLSTDKSLRIYKVKDISQGGLSFQHYSNQNKKLTNNSINITIFSGGRIAYEQKSCSVIYDIYSLEEGQSLSGRYSRLCGVKFTEYITDVKFKAMKFIKPERLIDALKP